MDYDKYINKTIQSVKPSGIRKFFDIANEMEDVISLSVGEPDFQTPWHIWEHRKTLYRSNAYNILLSTKNTDS